MLTGTFLAAALVLTFTMFHTRNMVLGFPCGIFWALTGGAAYDISASTWDLYYDLFFAAMGMCIFTIYAAYTLRRSDLGPPDEPRFFDEKEGSGAGSSAIEEPTSQGYFGENDSESSKRQKGLRDRASGRKSKTKARDDWEEF